MPKDKRPKLPPGALSQAPKLVVEDGQLVIKWLDGPRPTTLIISAAGYEAMVAAINRSQRAVAKVVALATAAGVQSRTDDDQPAGQPGVDTSMSATPQ